MAADERAFGFLHFRCAAAQDGVDDFGRHDIRWHAEQVHRRERTAPHRIDIRQRVGGGDLPIDERGVHDGREKVHRLHEGAIRVDAIDPGVIGSGRADEQVGITHLGKLTQDLHQGLLA